MDILSTVNNIKNQICNSYSSSYDSNIITDILSKIPSFDPLPSFICPISQEIMTDPVILSDGHTYEREYIIEWFIHNTTSPVTGLQIDPIVFDNIALRNSIQEWSANVYELKEIYKNLLIINDIYIRYPYLLTQN